MKRALAVLFLLLIVPVLGLCNSEYKVYNTEHFYFSVPSEWTVDNEEKNVFCFLTDVFTETSGAQIYFLETNHPEVRNFELTEYYKIMRNGILKSMNNPIYTSEFFDFDDSIAIVFSCKTEGLELCHVLFHKEDYSLSATGISAAFSSDDLRDLVISAFETVQFGTPPKEYAPYDYVTAVRNPERCEGDYVYLEGTVAQVIGSRKNGYRIRLRYENNYGHMVYIMIGEENAPSSNILEDDLLLIKGITDGEHTYETKDGDYITLPLVTAHSVDILNLKQSL